MSDTKEIIQARLLSNISNELDKRQGSFIYDIEKTLAIELEKAYNELETILNKGFADTAEGEYLEKITREHGVYRKEATKSSGRVKITGIEGSLINKGEVVASDNATFIFLEDKVISAEKTIEVEVECEAVGSVGNVPEGAIRYFPKTLEGLQAVTNLLAFTNGYEAENDKDLRDRYYLKIQIPATSGNKWHYLNWAKEVTGVGDSRVYPLWNGPGTVKVVIINSNKRAPDSDLIEEVYNNIEENRPIGAAVTVVGATEKAINIKTTLTIDTNNYDISTVKANIESKITDYLKEVAFKEDYIFHSRIANLIFNTEGVLDYNNLTINNVTSNIKILENEVAILGGVVIE